MSDYKIRNGILEKDGVKTYLIGESYYPSFHAYKWPVPPEGDRIGEMKKDFKAMAEMGINHVRIAALGFAGYKDGKFVIDTPFVDAMIEEAEKNDISISVRLEGYTVNLRDFKDVLMLDENGAPQDTTSWADFIQTTMCHEGILEDNRVHAELLARYYEKFKNVVAYQIYNEPHFPGKKIFDYHPCVIEAYRKWLVSHGYMTEEEVRDYNPPKSRRDQTPEMWALWRYFGDLTLNNFLINASMGAKKGSDRPTYTCYTDRNLVKSAPFRGEDPFGCSKGMDMIGYTDYELAEGELYYQKALLADMQNDIAEAQGKTALCVEQDCRIVLPDRQFEKSVFTALGAGLKGLIYYQWRGDAPSIGTPNPNSCGAVNFDGTKTVKFDSVKNCTEMLHRLSPYLVEAHPVYAPVGIMLSPHAVYYSDAVQNTTETPADTSYNRTQEFIVETYRGLHAKGIRPVITSADFLKENALGIKVLITPYKDFLSKEEVAIVEEFIEKGGTVYSMYQQSRPGYREFHAEPKLTPIARSNCIAAMSIDDIRIRNGLTPVVWAESELLAVQPLKGPDYLLMSIVNTATPGLPAYETTVSTSYPHTSAYLISPNGDRPLETDGRTVKLGTVDDKFTGGVLILK